MDASELLERYAAGERDFSRASLSEANLGEANLRGANLRGANLRGANLRKTNFRGADLSGANLIGANLSEANLSEADLSGANLIEADLSGADLSGRCYLSEADLSGRCYFSRRCDLGIYYLSGANLRGANLRGANLRGADLSGANLRKTNFRGADLSGADLFGADFSGADLSGADLFGADFSGADLSGANLIKANFRGADLSGASLSEANLGEANLRRADLSGFNLSGFNLSGLNLGKVNLSGANLSKTQLLNAVLKEATLTGACIEDWHTNSQTELSGVVCDYIYLKYDESENCFTERRPHDPNKIFAPGEFTKLFQKALETVDLIFSNGVDWQAFLSSFQKLQVECDSDELSINSFENKGDGTFVIRVNVPSSADKAEIEKYLKRLYQLEAQVEAKSEQLANLMEITKLLASRPINVEAKAMAENQSKNVEVEMNANSGAQINNMVGKNSGGIHNYAPEQKQTLAEAAKEIQKLLKQLEQTNPTATEPEQIAYVDGKTTPSFKRRAAKALVAGGEAAIEEFLKNPYVNVVKAIVKGWIEAQ